MHSRPPPEDIFVAKFRSCPPSSHPQDGTNAPVDGSAKIMRPGGIKQRDVAPVQTFAKAAAKCSSEVRRFLHGLSSGSY